MPFIVTKKWNYYNDFDEKTAAWARELIRRGLLPDGEVDARSILEVQPHDLRGFTQCHFFCGILGWPLALRMAGWPDDRPVWTGSPPCQPFSAAGRQKGKDDERHLAPHFAALVAECKPPVLFGEQVASAAVFGKATGRSGKSVEGQAPLEWAWLDDLFERLEAAHYACGASDIPAAGVGAAHIRQRTFFGAVNLDWTERGVGDTANIRCGDGTALGGLGSAQRSIHSEAWEGNGETVGVASGADGLADADDERSQGRPGMSERAGERLVGAGGVGGGLADTLHAGRPEWRPCAGSGSAAGSGGGIDGVADAHGWDASAEWQQRLGQHRREPQDGGSRMGAYAPAGEQNNAADCRRPDASDLGWPSADWLYCRDGKWRPVEPSTLPLAHGVSARVGRLRGYGNAIVPQAAAEFIKAFDAASAECFRLNDMPEMATNNGVFG